MVQQQDVINRLLQMQQAVNGQGGELAHGMASAVDPSRRGTPEWNQVPDLAGDDSWCRQEKRQKKTRPSSSAPECDGINGSTDVRKICAGRTL